MGFLKIWIYMTIVTKKKKEVLFKQNYYYKTKFVSAMT
jgi:hypothetical protein